MISDRKERSWEANPPAKPEIRRSSFTVSPWARAFGLRGPGHTPPTNGNLGKRIPRIRLSRERGPIIHRQGGFTLVEMLLALTLVALLMGGAYEILHMARRARNQAEDAVRLNQVGRACLDRMRRDLQALVREESPYNTGLYGEDGESFGPSALGNESFPGDWVTFLSASGVPRIASMREDPDNPSGEVAADLREIQYFVGSDEETEGQGLIRMRKIRLNHALNREEDAWASEVFAEEVLGLNLRYLDGEDGTWKDAWDTETQEAYPLAVEITITVGILLFDGEGWTAEKPDGSPTARKSFCAVVPLRMLPQEKLGAKGPEKAVVR